MHFRDPSEPGNGGQRIRGEDGCYHKGGDIDGSQKLLGGGSDGQRLRGGGIDGT